MGFVVWAPGGSFVSKCHIDIRAYPFDVQECRLKFGNWVYGNHQVNISLAEKLEETSSTTAAPESGNGEWEIAKTISYRDETVYCCPIYEHAFAHFVYVLRRKPLYYVINVICPSAMLSLLVLLVLRLPPESGEKISMGVTLLLSFAVYMLMVSDNLPVTSDHVPILGNHTAPAQ